MAQSDVPRLDAIIRFSEMELAKLLAAYPALRAGNPRACQIVDDAIRRWPVPDRLM
jgi:hypothetical protein